MITDDLGGDAPLIIFKYYRENEAINQRHDWPMKAGRVHSMHSNVTNGGYVFVRTAHPTELTQPAILKGHSINPPTQI